MGRKHNSDFMLVAMPMAFRVILNRDDDLATATLEFPTVHGSGMFEKMTPAPISRACSRRRSTSTRLCAT